MNHWDEHFKDTLEAIPVGGSEVFYYLSGARKGVAVKLPDSRIRWCPAYVGDSSLVVITVDECVDEYGYH